MSSTKRVDFPKWLHMWFQTLGLKWKEIAILP